MIRNLKIKNFALLKDVDISFEQGFTVISGETGAGKSIIFDAISLLSGKRVERFSGNKNYEKSVIEGVFIIDKSKKEWFESYDIDFYKETYIRREIYPNRKSRAFINDTPVLLNILIDFGKQIIEIHDQNKSLLLKEDKSQFLLIDQLADTSKDLLYYQDCFEKYNQLKLEISNIKESGSLSLSELDFLQFQFNEINQANLKLNEKDELEKKITVLDNFDKISDIISDTEQLFNKDLGILSSLSYINRKFSTYKLFDELSKRINSVLIELNDINEELASVSLNLESNPKELFSLNNRLNVINNLLQKHRKNNISDLIEYKTKIEQKIQSSSIFDEKLKNMENKLEIQSINLRKAAKILNKKRNKVTPLFKENLEENLKLLGMPFAQFRVDFSLSDCFHLFGNTNIRFMFSANKGSDLQEISKVASGGEVSRLMLAIKYISAQSSNINTLFFDEIDTGVSGEIASLMGVMMQEISKKNQLITISHLPQIASKAEVHLKVVKKTNLSFTISDIIKLDKNKRIEEIAKLLSGKKITKSAIDNAVDLLNQ